MHAAYLSGSSPRPCVNWCRSLRYKILFFTKADLIFSSNAFLFSLPVRLTTIWSATAFEIHSNTLFSIFLSVNLHAKAHRSNLARQAAQAISDIPSSSIGLAALLLLPPPPSTFRAPAGQVYRSQVVTHREQYVLDIFETVGDLMITSWFLTLLQTCQLRLGCHPLSLERVS